jgi:formate dehydrogenase major subunit
MATRDSKPEQQGVSRRTFLKTSAAVAAAGSGALDFAVRTSTAHAAQVAATYSTTCPYCSASCGQLVDVDAAGNVLDIYGDKDSPNNTGGLCAKGAGSYQLVTNTRRLGVPENIDGLTQSAYKRLGNGAWTPIALDTALDEIAQQLVSIRGSITPGLTAASNATSVQFFGSSHMNNEPNYLYRKLIAQFGTSRVEHQARI